VVLSIVPGAVIGGVIAYLIAWAMIPESPDVLPLPPSRLRRSTADQQIAGVCGGLAEYFGVDSTVVRVLWVLLSIFGGAVVGGLIAYALAWLIIPRAPQLLAAPASGESA
jgi:phage shock protein C